MTTRWLTSKEQRAWRAYIAAAHLLEDAIDRQLQQDAGMPHLYYSILANLSEVPERRLRMTDLAERTKITRSRLTYAVSRLEKDGLIRRENCKWDKRGASPHSPTRAWRCWNAPRPDMSRPCAPRSSSTSPRNRWSRWRRSSRGSRGPSTRGQPAHARRGAVAAAVVAALFVTQSR